jgi:very-short-patch-repair endonuclease
MHVERPTQSSVDAVIARIAARQHGCVARWQLLDAGVTREQIAVRVESGRFVQLHRGVYLVGAVAPEHAHAMAALLAFRLDAALSHRSAAALWALLPYPATAPVWITIPPGRDARRPRIEATRALLEPQDQRVRYGMRLTSPPRTILDLAALIEDPYELERIVADAAYRRLAVDAELRDQLERNPGKRGAPRLRRIVQLPGSPKRTRSPAERAMLRLLRRRGISGFETNARVHGYEVDFYWPREQVVVEVDGWGAHSSRKAFEDDRLKAAHLQAHGIAVMRVTGRQLDRDPDGVAVRLLAVLRGHNRPLG